MVKITTRILNLTLKKNKAIRKPEIPKLTNWESLQEERLKTIPLGLNVTPLPVNEGNLVRDLGSNHISDDGQLKVIMNEPKESVLMF